MKVDINLIKPDPNNPRKYFDENHIQGLAKSMKVEGMINNIEIDENNIIITGECRFRAARYLGWTEVPVQVNKSGYGTYERLRHQLAENVHQSGSTYETMMNPVDTAKGYMRLIIMRADYIEKDQDNRPGRLSFPTEEEIRDAFVDLSFEEKYGHVKELADEMGVSVDTIDDHVKLLRQPEFVLKDIAENDRPRTYYRVADSAPKEIKDQIKEKIAQGDYNSREEIQQDVLIAKQLPDLGDIALIRQKSKESAITNQILNATVKLGLALEKTPFEEIDVREKQLVKNQLDWIIERIMKYLS